MTFDARLRRLKSKAFDLPRNSSARRTVSFDLWGRPVRVYANANLSIYTAQPCNARCPFCVEELRPASRGVELARQKSVERDDRRYFTQLNRALHALEPLSPSVSITGGEPSLDPRLPAILQTLVENGARKRTLTTNGSGLLQMRGGRRVLDWITACGVQHLNVSRAHPNSERNDVLMQLPGGLSHSQLREVVSAARAAGTRVRLSCVLLGGAIDSVDGIRSYLDFAAALGVDNVIFRQLMKPDHDGHAINHVIRYSDTRRVLLEPLLESLGMHPEFSFCKQIVGYYYYVEIWLWGSMDVVFEEADLAQLEAAKRADPEVIHELVFHPNAALASTWQPWDGVLIDADHTEARMRGK
jgi:molybdenum cofactor biosynthesis enzyme MoaA